MNCPKCKIEVSPKDPTCPNCEVRLSIDCPRCDTPTRLGNSSCKKCGFVFVKFCENCNCANYVSAKQCRKCFHEFSEFAEAKSIEAEDVQAVQNGAEQKIEVNQEIIQEKQEKPSTAQQAKNEKLIIYIDFLTLEGIFNKYKDEEFRQKVILNIKTSIKIGFNANCEFIEPKTAVFKVNYAKKFGLLSKIQNFSEEFEKFNNILNETLGSDITYKYAIITEDEKQEIDTLEQLHFGGEKDIIVSNSAYEILNSELSLIKISPNSYKMVFLEQKPVFSQNELMSEEAALELIVDTINDEQSEIDAISLNAPRGAGKTHLINLLRSRFEDSDKILLLGQCTPLTQISPIGLFQDIFLTLFNLSFAPSKYEKRIKELRSILAKGLTSTAEANSEQIDTVVNLIYPLKEDYFENILDNKQKTFENLKTILETLRADNKVVLIIDDFDLIDETSFEFLKYLIENNFFKNGTKLILAYRNQHAIGMYINSDKINKNTCLNISLANKDHQNIRNYIRIQLGKFDVLPDKILNQILLNAHGNFAYIEQILTLLVEQQIVRYDNDCFEFDQQFNDYFVPQKLEDILIQRFSFLKQSLPEQFNLLGLASFLGGKFNKSILSAALDLKDEEFVRIATGLVKNNFIKRVNENCYMFKNNLVWTHVYDMAKEDEDLKVLGQKFLDEICKKTVSSPTIKALLAQTIGDKLLAFDLWTQNLKIASYIGDTGLYITSQKQSLAFLNENKVPNEKYIKNNICERLGKLVYAKNPKEGIDYLTNAIIAAQNQNDIAKVIELSGYLLTSAKLAQNFHGMVETVDNVLKIYSDSKYSLQRAMIKTRKLNALLQIGNWEEISILVNNEINPTLQAFLKKPKKIDFSNFEDVYASWIHSNIVLANAYALQGNSIVFELIEEIEKEIFKDKSPRDKKENIEIKINLALVTALAYSVKGYVKVSDEILQSIVKDFSWAIEDSLLVSKWNTIDVLNKVLKHDFDKIKDELFNAVTFANNCDDEFSKNILKTLLAHVLLDEENALKALEICSEQMTYFANEKLALGALLSWYVSAKATMATNNYDKAIEICDKSIKISQSTKINCIYFTVLFQKIMTQCYLAKGDLESAKMYNEMGIELANANDITYLQMALYRLRANCMQDNIVKIPEAKKYEFAQNTIKIYEKAIGFAGRISLSKHKSLIQKELTAFRAYCQLNRIGE